jgi:hypothetical protein
MAAAAAAIAAIASAAARVADPARASLSVPVVVVSLDRLHHNEKKVNIQKKNVRKI